MSRPTTTGCLPHSRLEATDFTLQPETDLQETPAEKSPDNQDIAEQPAS